MKRKTIGILLAGSMLISTIFPAVTYAANETTTQITDSFLQTEDLAIQQEEIQSTQEKNEGTDEVEESTAVDEQNELNELEDIQDTDESASETENLSEETEILSDESLSDIITLPDEQTEENSIEENTESTEQEEKDLKETERKEEIVGEGENTPISLTNAIGKTYRSSYDYTGYARRPTPIVQLESAGKIITLKQDVDYTATYSNNKNPGKGKITIQGIGKYTDSINIYFNLVHPISKTNISYKNIVANTGNGYSKPTIKLNTITLKENTNYTITYSKKKITDTYTTVTMLIKGKGYYTGSITKEYTLINNTTKISNNQSYKIILAADTTKSLGLGSLESENAAIKVRKNNGSNESRLFITKLIGNGQYKIISQRNDFLMKSKDNNASKGSLLVAQQEKGNLSDRFKIQYNNDGSFSFISVKSGNAVTVKNSTEPDTKLEMNSFKKSKYQKFYLVPVSAVKHTYSGIYRIKSAVNQNYVLNVKNGAKFNGANINVDENIKEDWQLFRLVYSGDNTYRIQCAHTLSMLTIKDKNLKNFANVQQYQKSIDDIEKWKIQKNSDGTVTFLNAKDDSFALDLYAGTAKSGANVDIYKKNNTKAQKWYLEKAIECYYSVPSASELVYRPENQQIVDYAKTWVGKISYTLGANGKLVNGGKSDCSWFIFRVMEHFGKLSAWHKSLEYGRGTVPNTVLVKGGIKNAKPGDILMWDEGGGAGHVIIYAGNGMAVGCNGLTEVTGSVDYREYTYPCGREPDAIARFTNLD